MVMIEVACSVMQLALAPRHALRVHNGDVFQVTSPDAVPMLLLLLQLLQITALPSGITGLWWHKAP